MKYHLLISLAVISAILATPGRADNTNDSPLLGAGDAANIAEPGAQASINVDPTTLSAKVSIPLVNLPGRGLPLQLSLNYTGNFLQPQYTNVNLVPWSASFGISSTEQAGWRFVAPSTATLTHLAAVYNVVPNPYDPSQAGSYFPCKILGHEFRYTAPSGQVTYFYPSINPQEYVASAHYGETGPGELANGWFCSAIGGGTMPFSDYFGILQTLGTTFYSADGSGRIMRLTGGSTNLSAFTTLPASNYDVQGAVARVIETDGTYTEFALFDTALSTNTDSTGQALQILATGVPYDTMDRFGNTISIAYTTPTDIVTSGGTTTGTITLTDTVGRIVTLSGISGAANPAYWSRYSWPASITVQGYYPDGSNEVISFISQALTMQGMPGLNPTTGADAFGTTWFGGFSGVSATQGNYPMNTVVTGLTTLSEIALPGGLKWQFSYDRGWGNFTTPAKSGSSSLAVVPASCDWYSYYSTILPTHSQCPSKGDFCYCDAGAKCFMESSNLGNTLVCNGSNCVAANNTQDGDTLGGITPRCNADDSPPSNPSAYSGSCCSYSTGVVGASPAQSTLISDGSLTRVTTPTGTAFAFTLAGEGGASLRSLSGPAYTAAAKTRMSYFLDPSQETPLEEFKQGYVQTERTYYPSGQLASEVDFASVVPAPGDAAGALTEQVTANYLDAHGNPVKVETHHFTNQKVQFTDDSLSVTDPASGSTLKTVANSYDCVTVTNQWVGSPIIPGVFSGYLVEPVGYCLNQETDTRIDSGPQTAEATDYDMTSLNRPLWTPSTQPCASPTSNYTCSPANVVPRMSGQRLYDGGTSGSGTLMRTKTRTYFDAYVNSNNLIDLVAIKHMFDGSGGTVTSLHTSYDDQAVAQVTGLPQYSPQTVVGLATTNITHDPNTGLADLVTHISYDSAGIPVSSTDANGNVTTTQYDPSAGCGGSLPTASINPLNQTDKMTYYCGSGRLQQKTGPNGTSTTYVYNDPLLRPTLKTDLDSTGATLGSVSHVYDDQALTWQTNSNSGSGALYRSVLTQLDGFGRAIQTTTTNPNGSGPGTTESVGIDSQGRTVSRTNTYGATTTTHYDALDRVIEVDLPNSTKTTSQYNDRVVRAYDIYGRMTQSTVDYFRNLVSVISPDGQTTQYTYNSLNKLLSANEASGLKRTFTYDGFGRRLTEMFPEVSGVDTIQSYDANGNITHELSAGGYVITTTYDALNRPTLQSYQGPQSTPTVTYSYDAPGALGLLAGVLDGNAGRAYTYDNAGRLWYETLYIGGGQYPLTYQYNSLSQLDGVILPDGSTATLGYNSAANLNSVNWSALGATASASYQIQNYALHGAVQNATLGSGLSETNTYEPALLRQTDKEIDQGSKPIVELSYQFVTTPQACSGGPGGFNSADGSDISQINESIGGASRTLSFEKDCLSRIAGAQATGSSTWSLTYAYDNQYNRVAQNVGAGSSTQAQSIAQSTSFDSHNHVQDFIYDAAGNVTDDGVNTYVYDGAGRLVQSTSKVSKSITSYGYLGEYRVSKSSGVTTTHYVRDHSGTLLSEFSSSSTSAKAAPTVSYYLKDNLDSVRAVTDVSGNIVSSRNFFPFGEEETSSTDTVSWKYAGHERDGDTGDDYMNARYYSSTTGVFLSVDRATPDLLHPQTLNRYSYVFNDPIDKNDPTGNWPSWSDIVQSGKQMLYQEGQAWVGVRKHDYNNIVSIVNTLGGHMTPLTPANHLQEMAYEGRNPDGSIMVMQGTVMPMGGAGAKGAAAVVNFLEEDGAQTIAQNARLLNAVIDKQVGEAAGEKSLTVMGHGFPNSIQVGEGQVWSGEYGASKIANLAKEEEASCITLFACSTGKGANNLAQKVANKSGLPVRAPTDDILVKWDGENIRHIGIDNGGGWKLFNPQQ